MIYCVATSTGDDTLSLHELFRSSPCEPLTVTPVAPGIVTKAQTPVTVGGTAHDTATLSGLVSADGTGTVTFTAYSDSLCKTTALFSSTVPSSGGISANGDITSDD